MRQAYLQSAEPLARDVFIAKPVPQVALDPSRCLKSLKPLNEICEYGDLWHEIMDHHHGEYLGMKPQRSDLAVYVLMKGTILKGRQGGYVDDLIRSGNKDFRMLAKKASHKFDMADDQELPCIFRIFSKTSENRLNRAGSA